MGGVYQMAKNKNVKKKKQEKSKSQGTGNPKIEGPNFPAT